MVNILFGKASLVYALSIFLRNKTKIVIYIVYLYGVFNFFN